MAKKVRSSSKGRGGSLKLANEGDLTQMRTESFSHDFSLVALRVATMPIWATEYKVYSQNWSNSHYEIHSTMQLG